MNNSIQSMKVGTILQLTLLFGAEEYFVQRQAAFNGEDPTPLSAMVTRRWCDEDGQVSPATGKVYNDLSFVITDTINEDPSGARFLVNAVATTDLQMEHGSIAVTKDKGNAKYAEGMEGICKGTKLKMFVDLQSHTGTVLSFAISDGYVIKLSLPDDIHFNPDPDPKRSIPYSLRSPFREDIICQHRAYTPPAPASDTPAPEPAAPADNG